MATDVRVGVDLGTTWTAAAVWAGGEPEAVSLGPNGTAMPSVVAIVDGGIVAGHAAVRAASLDPAGSAREFKRRLGDTSPIVLGGSPYGAETLMGHLLTHVLGVVREQAGEPTAVTLTHPAAWGEYKLDLLREAGRVAGLGSIDLLSEPAAAALHYARLGRLKAGDTVAVYDFGGGTFDAAVVRLDPSGPRLLGKPEGLERLGGIDLDHAVFAHVDASLDGALRELDTADPDVRRGLLALRADCIEAKEALSVDTEVTISVVVPGLHTDVRVTRGEFESVVRPRLSETLGALDRAVSSADVAPNDLAGIVLVGGSSRIPLVVEQVGAHTGRPLLTDADPKLVVVLGAAPHSAHAAPTMEDTMSTTNPPAAERDPKDAPEGTAAGAAAKEGGGEGAKQGAQRRTAPGQREPEQSGLSTLGKVAAGVAAAGAATAAGVFWRDDLAEAAGIGGDDDTAAEGPQGGVDPATVAAAEAVPVVDAPPVAPEGDDSMDVFDAVSAPPGGAMRTGGGASAPGPSRGPSRPEPAERFETAAPTAAATAGAATAPRPAAPPPPPGAGTTAPPQTGAGTATPTGADMPTTGSPMTDAATDRDFETARQQLHERLDAWTPPEGADETEVAELRARLDGLLDRYEPRPGQSIDDAIAELRDEFEVRIENFTQDQQIDALIEEVSDLQGGSGAMTPDPEFEALRNRLRDSLADWEAPEGTSPEDAAELRTQLEALVDRYQPAGRPADDALADLRAAFDERVQDFVQDQKIDALVEEQMGGAPDTETPTPTTGDMSTGDMPADDAEPDMPTDDMAPDGPLVKPVGDAPGSSVLVDEFDTMIEAEVEPGAPMQGIAIGEMDPTSRPATPDLDDDVFNLGDLFEDPAPYSVTPTDETVLPVLDDLAGDDMDVVAAVIDERLTTSIDDLVPAGAPDGDGFAPADLDMDDLDLDDQPDADNPL